MDQLLDSHSIEEVCAHQWRACIESALSAFERIEGEPVIKVSYESLVRSPVAILTNILDKLEMPARERALIQAAEGISTKSVGKGRRELEEAMVQKLEPIIGPSQKKLGYGV